MNLNFIESFLLEYSEFRIKPTTTNSLVLEGDFERELQFKDYAACKVAYSLSIQIPPDYPFKLPTIYESEDRIANVPSNHINPDGSFCLGSPIRLKLVLKKSPELKIFFESCVLPYLYAVTINQITGEGFVFGELEHGDEGLISDFKNLFHLKSSKGVYQMLKILECRKKAGNRMMCPCGCNERVTKCDYFSQVIKMRKTFTRTEWKEQFELVGGI